MQNKTTSTNNDQGVTMHVNMTRITIFHAIDSIMRSTQRCGIWRCVLPLVCGLMFAGQVYAVQGTEFIAPPKYSLTDRYSVNHFNGEVSLSVDTVAIGGERGLSHSVTARTNLFEYPANRGFTDKFAAALKYKEIGQHVPINMGEPTHDLVWVMSATALGESADFLVMRNGAYVMAGRDLTSNYYYEAIGDKRHTLKRDGSNRVWTQPDGTQVFFGGGLAGAGWSSSASKIVYPNGFTFYLHNYTGVTTNTGYQLKFDYINDDPGLAPEKRNRSFPEGSWVPTEYQSTSAQWRTKNPKYIYAINRAVEYCDESITQPCSLDPAHNWPKATFSWPGGMPRAIYIDETDVIIENAAGGKARLHYEAFDTVLDASGEAIDGYEEGIYIGPRLVAYTPPGASQPTVRYTYKNHFTFYDTGNGSVPRWLTRRGSTATAQGIMGSAAYSLGSMGQPGTVGQWGEIIHTGGGIRAHVSTTLPGTLQELHINNEISIYNFEASYRNFPVVVGDYNGPDKAYTYDNRGNVTRVEHLPRIDGQEIAYTAGYPTTCGNPKTCNKPEWVEDARGNRTDYTYHPESGQVATVTGPPDQNGVRPVTRYDYGIKVGNARVPWYAYYKKNSDSIEPADTPIWLLTREATCRTTATTGNGCAGGALDEVVTEYDYGPQDGTPNNLHLRSVSVTAEAGGALVTRSTCYEYDIYGNRISETRPKAGECVQ